MIGLCLKVSGTDACLVIGKGLSFLGAFGVYLGLTLLGIALGALGRDRPSALVVLFVAVFLGDADLLAAFWACVCFFFSAMTYLPSNH